ncbi:MULTISPECIES: hypothetical protein [unclassified Pseudomonas]|uniref:hypothetical protein n=1 Tax=unclassified Pseudomonas TaxID=196821 RepID=UPI001A90F04D|nr:MULTISPECIES: hypothetical protein [unclassified Pseudomonas]
MDDRAYRELTNQAPQHAEALSEICCSGQIAGWGAVGRQVDRAGEGAGRAGTLQQTPELRDLQLAQAKQCRADGNQCTDRHDIAAEC